MDSASIRRDTVGQLHTAVRARGECRGTFGELLQGVLPDNRHFLVTLPITTRSVVEFEPSPTDHIAARADHKSKSCRAVRDYLQLLGLPPGGILHFDSALPVGKGLASSSADMVAAIRAAAACYCREAAPELIELILRFIEPTDGVMYDGIVSFYHREVMLDEKLGAVPHFAILSVDRGGECDTLQFNRVRREIPATTRGEYDMLLSRMKAAIREGDVRTMGTIATRSCELSQATNPHPHFEALRSIGAEIDALGTVATHSGTCIGLLLDATRTSATMQAAYAIEQLAARGIETRQFTTA
ncbi:GHMP kinase [Burkholderia sp. F1]|uniref:GHMP family kinase ATP-binding protein n=1 Tax=Burkholderia sp. F1 TaxID=3366817 RepID=UPI003D716B3E